MQHINHFHDNNRLHYIHNQRHIYQVQLLHNMIHLLVNPMHSMYSIKNPKKISFSTALVSAHFGDGRLSRIFTILQIFFFRMYMILSRIKKKNLMRNRKKHLPHWKKIFFRYDDFFKMHRKWAYLGTFLRTRIALCVLHFSLFPQKNKSCIMKLFFCYNLV